MRLATVWIWQKSEYLAWVGYLDVTWNVLLTEDLGLSQINFLKLQFKLMYIAKKHVETQFTLEIWRHWQQLDDSNI